MNNLNAYISINQFVNLWNDSDRKNSFSRTGLETLYCFIEDNALEIDLSDIIAIDCEFAEYNVIEYASEYLDIKQLIIDNNLMEIEQMHDNSIELILDDDKLKELILDEVCEKTIVLMIDDDNIIIGNH